MTTPLTRAAVGTAMAEHHLEPLPWSLAALLLSDDGTPRLPEQAAGPALDAVQARLLASATFVCEMVVVLAGAATESRWLHDGTDAMLVNLAGEPCLGPATTVTRLLQRLSEEVADGASGPLVAEQVAHDGALVLRSLHLGETDIGPGPVLHLAGPPGHRAMVTADEPAQLAALSPTDLLVLLQVMFADPATLEALEEPVPTSLSAPELVALGVTLDDLSLVQLAAVDSGRVEELARQGLAELAQRPADVVDELAESLLERGEEIRCLTSSPEQQQAILVRIGRRDALTVSRVPDGFQLVEGARAAALAAVHRQLAEVSVPTQLLLSRERAADGRLTATALRHDGQRWVDADGADGRPDIDALLHDEQALRQP